MDGEDRGARPCMIESNEAERNEVFGGTIPTIPYYYVGTSMRLFYLKKKAILSRFSSFPSPAPFRSPSMPMKPI